MTTIAQWFGEIVALTVVFWLGAWVYLQTGLPKGQCVAAAAVDIFNGKRGGKRMRNWWVERQ